MLDWFKTALADIKPRARWDFIKVCIVLLWPLMLTLAATIISKFMGFPVAAKIYILVPVVSFLFQSLIGLFLYIARGSRIDISVSMDDGWSAYQGITVTNNGRQNLFRAEGQIVGSNGPANYPKGTFRLGWGNGTQPDVTIPQHASDQILVGGFEDVTNAHSLFDLRVFKLVNNESQIRWNVRWLAEDKDELPWFQLKVSVIAEGTRTPWVRTFLLIPKTRLGPLCLSAVEETT